MRWVPDRPHIDFRESGWRAGRMWYVIEGEMRVFGRFSRILWRIELFGERAVLINGVN